MSPYWFLIFFLIYTADMHAVADIKKIWTIWTQVLVSSMVTKVTHSSFNYSL